MSTAQFQSGSLPSGFASSAWSTGSGLYPYLTQLLHCTDPEAVRQKVVSGEIVVPNFFDLKPGQKEMGTPSMATPPSVANAK